MRNDQRYSALTSRFGVPVAARESSREQSMPYEPLVSVIIPTYNRAKLLPRAIDSCLDQTHKNVEVLVVDDGSTDDTLDLMRQYVGKHGLDRIRLFQQSHGGAWRARNLGMDNVRGKYIQFLDSDDYLAPEKFEVQVKSLEASGNPIAVCDCQLVHGSPSGERGHLCRNSGDLLRRLSHQHRTGIFSPLIRADAVPDYLRFRQLPHQYGDDPDFIFRLFLHVTTWDYTPGVFALYIHHGHGQITSMSPPTKRWGELADSACEYFRAHRHDIPKANWNMVTDYVYSAALKLYHRADDVEARRLTRRLVRMPGGVRKASFLFPAYMRTLSPAWFSRLLRRLRVKLSGA